jgi:hypothetical protein
MNSYWGVNHGNLVISIHGGRKTMMILIPYDDDDDDDGLIPL